MLTLQAILRVKSNVYLANSGCLVHLFPFNKKQRFFGLAFNSELSSPLTKRMLSEPFYISEEEKWGHFYN